MRATPAPDPAVQTVGVQEITEPEPIRPVRPFLVFLGLAAALILTMVIATTATEPNEPERVVRSFAAAIDDGDSDRARTFIADPTIVMWPTYWSVLNLEHISPFGDRLAEFVAYHHALGTETTLAACNSRPTLPEEVSEYDIWIRCDYVLTDALAIRLEGTGGSTKGQLSFGMADHKIRTVFAIRSDQPDELTRFRSWLTVTHPDSYAELLQQPAVLQLDVPIMGLVVIDYNRDTAIALLQFADEYAGAGSP